MFFVYSTFYEYNDFKVKMISYFGSILKNKQRQINKRHSNRGISNI